MAEESILNDEPLFDPSLKKKKKKKVVAFDEDPLGADGMDTPAVESAPPVAVATPGPSILKNVDIPPPQPDAEAATKSEDLDAMFGDLKKKKKKKKDLPLDFGDEQPAGGADGLDDLPKTKKKPKKAAFDLDAFERGLDEANATAPAGQADGEDGGDIGEEEDLGEDVFAVSAPAFDDGGEKEPWLGSDRDYTYAELLGRIFRTLQAQNPDFSSSRKRYTIVPPSVHRDGNKKTVFANVAEICKRMHRQPEHVIQFLFAELGTTGSVDGEKRLVIRGRFQQKQLENVLRRYIVEYVTCKTCKSPDTLLTKENRLYFMSCEACGSRRSVSAIKTGFQAQVGKRPKKLQ